MDPTTVTDTLNIIDFSPLVEWLFTFVGLALTALLGLASRYIAKKTGVEVDLKNNAIINEAIERGMTYARTKIADNSTMETKNDMVALAASYAIAGAPKALKYFDIDPPRLAEMIFARFEPADLLDTPA